MSVWVSALFVWLSAYPMSAKDCVRGMCILLSVQFGVPLYGAHQPALVQGLRDALYAAINEIKSLTGENKSLREQNGMLESRLMEFNKLKEELKQKDDLLKRANKKRRARTRAHVETLALLASKEEELKCSDEKWKRKYDALE